MANREKIYRRLTRNSVGVGSYSSLWLAADHLMVVRSTGYHESYSRVQLTDLKAIFLTPSDRRLWWGFFWGIIAAWSGTALAITLGNRETPIVSAIVFGFGAVGFVWNLVLGAGCRAYMLTGVQTAELPALVRMKKARHVLAELQPLIAAAQADLAVATPSVPLAASSNPPAQPVPTEPRVSALPGGTPAAPEPTSVAMTPPPEPAADFVVKPPEPPAPPAAPSTS